MAWYRLYRPRQVQQLNIAPVREALQQMMQTGKVPQSLLFAGPKGTGKTSASRIMGAMLNDPANAAAIDHLFFGQAAPAKLALVEPDPESDFATRVYAGHSFVVQELDAASNRRIDDIRLLKERIDLPPTEGKVTVYILDEVHMLTTEAFNALLKILEEPPAHVVFILATTELHKIPATIVSRCRVIHFRRATADELQAALERVLVAEKIKFQPADLLPIVERADGSFRDAVKTLELACQTGQLDLASVSSLLAVDSLAHIQHLFELVLAKDASAVSQLFVLLREHNYNQKDFYKDCLHFLHQDLLANLGVVSSTAWHPLKVDQFLLKELLAAELNQESPIPFLVLELKLLELIERAKGKEPATKTVPPEDSSTTTPPTTATTAKKKIEVAATAPLPVSSDLKTSWQQLLAALQPEHFSLKTLLKSCTLESLQAGMAQVSVYYAFHKEQLEQNKNRSTLENLASELWGIPLGFEFVLQEPVAANVVTGADGAGGDFISQARDSLL